MSENIIKNETEQVWLEVLEETANQVSKNDRGLWLEPLELLELDHDAAHLLAPEEFHCEWVKSKYLEKLATAFKKVCKSEIKLKISYDEFAHAKTTIQLPLWPKSERAAPSGFLRSALFGVVRRGRRKQYKGEELASWRGTRLSYTGEALDQGDLDIWLQALELLRAQGGDFDQPIYFSLRDFLRQLGRAEGGKDHEWLKRGIVRMTACALQFYDGRYIYGGTLITNFGWDEYSGDYFIILNSKLVPLFLDNAYTRLRWETRLALKTNYSQWLHGYICSHQATPDNPHRIRIAMLAKLSRSSFSRQRDFRRKVEESLHELQQHGVLASWYIDERNVLTFVRVPQLR